MLLLLLAQPDANAAAATEALDDCADPQAQQEMNRCAYLDFQSADAALNEEWATTVAAMKAADAEIDREYDQQPGHYETLLEGQRAWLKYRDAQCLMESFEARGGSMQPMLENFCMTYLTELRIQQLRLMTAGPER
ncbi:lysozyme inhibitor LprI family protein [Altererythrobacter sp. Root672]|uniref:lysozyme inhibitor LprI family protein n=1 Tax=Altererythrobacter sp. Root672 TaxID=1736584 RepID=UPI0012E3C5CA|nr:lysozyme inhibitor LprI family protein [Altererythrobacter sp. Root672]